MKRDINGSNGRRRVRQTKNKIPFFLISYIGTFCCMKAFGNFKRGTHCWSNAAEFSVTVHYIIVSYGLCFRMGRLSDVLGTSLLLRTSFSSPPLPPPPDRPGFGNIASSPYLPSSLLSLPP
ncbi:hypothetical protein Tcan_00543, partial [Toxocara canis]